MIWLFGIGLTLYLFFSFPEKMIGLLIVLITIGGAVGVYIYWSDKNEKNKRELVAVVVSVDPNFCSDYRWPLKVQITNNSNQSVDEVSFGLDAFQPGFSDEKYDGYETSNKIILPRMLYTACYSLNDYSWKTSAKTPANYEWRASVSHVVWTAK